MTKTANNASLLIDFQTRSKQIKHYKTRHQNQSARYRISNSVRFSQLKKHLGIFFNMPNSFSQQKIKITPMHDLIKFDSILPESSLGWMPNIINSSSFNILTCISFLRRAFSSTGENKEKCVWDIQT